MTIGHNCLFRNLAMFCVLLTFVLAEQISPSVAQTTADNPPTVIEALQILRQSGRYEFDFPGSDNVKTQLEPLPSFSFERSYSSPPPSPAPALSGDVTFSADLQILLWILMALVLAYLLLPVLQRLILRLQNGGSLEGTAPSVSPTDQNEDPADEAAHSRLDPGDPNQLAEKLARDGDFAGAVHALWLATLADLEQRGLWTGSDSETTREILHGLARRGTGWRQVADTLRPISSRVELSHFGGRAMNAADYQASVRAIETFRSASTRTA